MMQRVVILLLLLSVWIVAGNRDIFIRSAQKQVGKTLTYNPEYAYIKYPMGDIPLSKGVCTDVVVRAFRGVDIDLQERIYKDKKKFPKRYKGLYYTDKLDPNIGICSDKRNRQGEPLILHNINSGAKEEDVLRTYRIVDHFRVFGR